ncbi:uncharacterized protein [Arachis hypogaea]|uniref:uncharacterized protein n=1 Tax=Arachis hypogaea TaxID=3818 RepID=UPI000DECA48F|nr:uncharacterized protein LOC112780093 [Arachis hypogaea]
MEPPCGPSSEPRILEVRRVGGVHSCLAPTISQDHRQLNSSLIYRVILPLIQSNPSVSILVLQREVQASYHFKPFYGKLWMAKQKAIAQIYGIGKKRTTRFPSCFRHCKAVFLVPFETYASNHSTMDTSWYGGVLHIAMAQDGNSNILPIAFVIVESEITESWSFFLTNLRRYVTPQDGLLVISDRSQAIKTALSFDDSGWHPPRAYHADYEWYMDALRRLSPTMVDWASHFRKEIWLQHCDSGCQFGHMTTNLSECINAVLKGTWYLLISAIVRITYERLQKLFVTKGKEAQSQLAAGCRFSRRLLATIEKNREWIPMIRVTYCDRRTSVFVVEELEPFEGWGAGLPCSAIGWHM